MLAVEDPAGAVDELLAQLPWSRTLRSARARFAKAAGIADEAIEAAFDARSKDERRRWIDNVTLGDPHLEVSSWVLESSYALAQAAPPRDGIELLSIACDLAAPISVLFAREASNTAWLEAAIDSAARLSRAMPQHPVGICADTAIVDETFAMARESGALAMARQGRIAISPPRLDIGTARSKEERWLFEALEHDARTAGAFELNRRIENGDEIDLLAAHTRIAVEVDGWHHLRDYDRYRRDRKKDLEVQKAGYLVMRYLAEDVHDRLELLVDEIAGVVRARKGTR